PPRRLSPLSTPASSVLLHLSLRLGLTLGSAARVLPASPRFVYASLPEKRKVGGSTPPLTTHSHQRICVCQLWKPWRPDRLVAARWRPFKTSGTRCGPMLSARRVHGRGFEYGDAELCCIAW